jgi:hypothetical protein
MRLIQVISKQLILMDECPFTLLTIFPAVQYIITWIRHMFNILFMLDVPEDGFRELVVALNIHVQRAFNQIHNAATPECSILHPSSAQVVCHRKRVYWVFDTIVSIARQLYSTIEATLHHSRHSSIYNFTSINNTAAESSHCFVCIIINRNCGQIDATVIQQALCLGNDGFVQKKVIFITRLYQCCIRESTCSSFDSD